jgi:mannitol/fructose-specific phosphotransferase system IIA component (Ntr-type)
MAHPPEQTITVPAIELPATAVTSPQAVIEFLLQHLAERGFIRAEQVSKLAAEILYRESLGSTAAGDGVALPHARSNAIGVVAKLIGYSASPINWPGAPDGLPISKVCLIICPADHPHDLLRALEEAASELRSPHLATHSG